jgi:RNA polymerase sigma-70 factor (ECF subfamily)
VARQILERGMRFAPHARPALVNGAAGAVVGSRGRPIAVVGFTVTGGRIVAIDLITDREKLAGVEIGE